MIRLHSETHPLWLRVVLHDLDAFLQDHAANERKVSASALKLAVQHPERTALVATMIELATEELSHFRRVYAVLRERGKTLAQDAPDPYMSALQKVLRKRVTSEFLLDRLLMFSVVEARACERFGMLAEAPLPAPLQQLYRDLTRAESRHHATFLSVARHYYPPPEIEARSQAILAAEAEIVAQLPLRSALH